MVGSAFLSTVCVADTITIDGTRYDGVYVRESDSRYYVQIPSNGQTLSAPKSRVDASQVVLTEDKSERDALLLEWRIQNAVDDPRAQEGTEGSLLSHGVSMTHPSPQETWESVSSQSDLRVDRSAPLKTHAALADPVTPRQQTVRMPADLDTGKATNGYVQPIKLDDIKLKEALDALLRPLNLDYEVRDGYIWISTAEKIRSESSEPLEVRTFHLNHAGGEVLPKIGLSNMGGPGGIVSGGTGYGGYGNEYGGGYRGTERGAYRGR